MRVVFRCSPRNRLLFVVEPLAVLTASCCERTRVCLYVSLLVCVCASACVFACIRVGLLPVCVRVCVCV